MSKSKPECFTSCNAPPTPAERGVEHRMFRRHPGPLLNVFCTFDFRCVQRVNDGGKRDFLTTIARINLIAEARDYDQQVSIERKKS